jgi:hypothetical protein
MSWAEGQAKIFLSFLLLASFYLGYKGRPALSGIAFALGAFDPRFAILAFPLFLFYNKNKLRNALGTMIITLVASNLMVLYPGTAQGFLNMILSSGGTTPFYTPSWIPLVMIVCLLAVNARQLVDAIKNGLSAHKERIE